MAKRIFQQASWSPAATADTTNLITANYMSLGAGNGTQLLKVIEIYIGGQASASTIEIMQWGGPLPPDYDLNREAAGRVQVSGSITEPGPILEAAPRWPSSTIIKPVQSFLR
jgi:hypothetical protein